MAFRKVGIFNDLSPKVFPKLPPRGTVVTYRFLQTFEDPYADTDEPIYKAVVQIPSLSICFDPEKNDWVEVGLVGAVEMDGTPTSSRIRRVWHRPHENGGLMSLTIGKADDDELYQYLEVASFNLSNPNRDENVQPMLERVDYEAEAREARNEIKAKLEAVKKASSIESKDLPRYASILGYDINDAEKFCEFAKTMLHEYDYLFYVSPKGVEMEDNGVRETDLQYRETIDSIIKYQLDFNKHRIKNLIHIKGSTELKENCRGLPWGRS